MTKFLETVLKTIIIALDTISLPVRFLIYIIFGTGIILFAKFIKKVDIGFKEGYLMLFVEFKHVLKKYWNNVVKLYAKD